MQALKVSLATVLGRLGVFPRWWRLPLVGDVDNAFAAPVAQLNSPRFGQSEGLPFVMEIVVDRERSVPADVGREVDRVFFQKHPPLIFNVSFACGKPGAFRRGVYGDPRSIWFNVFFGYYEIDVDVEKWKRPFGYEADGSTICWDDILRIGKSDWNYFSNYVYGVPAASIAPTNDLAHPPAQTRFLGRNAVGSKRWDEVEIDDALVVSAYDSGRKGEPQLVSRGLWSVLWQAAYGFPLKQPVSPQSNFFAVPMKAQLYMYHRKGIDNDTGRQSYQTFMFGGTINQWYSRQSAAHAQDNAAFLDEQLQAVRRVMTTSFPDLGY